MNDEKEKFRASLKVIQGGNGKNTSIDIPLEDNKEKDELEKEKKLLKIAYRYNGRCDSFVDVETVRRLREASEKFKKSYEAYLIAKNNLKKAKMEISPKEEYKIHPLYEEEEFSKVRFELDAERFQKILESYNKQVNENKPLDMPRFVNEGKKHLRESTEPEIKAPRKGAQHKNYKVQKKKHEKLKKIAKRVAAITGVLTLTAGVATYTYSEINRHIDKPIDMQVAQEEGKTIEQMGISEETAQKLFELNDEIKADFSQISMGEVMKMAKDNYQVSYEVLQEKLSNPLKTNEEDITFDIQQNDGPNDKTYYIKLKGNQEKYKYNNFLDLGFNSNMPKEIADYIEVIKENQDLLKELDEGKCTKEEAINKIGGSIDNTSRLVGGQDFYLVDGKIEVDVTRNSDIKKQREQKQNQIQESKNVSTKDLTDEER